MIYQCGVCGYIYDEEKEGKLFSELKECPICKQSVNNFKLINSNISDLKGKGNADFAYSKDTEKTDSNYRYIKEIHEMAITGKPIIEAMGTQMKMPNWDDVLILGAQLNPFPLEEHADVSLKTIIGKNAKKPMIIDT